jgi:molecular chaperone GrpE
MEENREEAGGARATSQPDARDRRIDELARAYSALLEDNKAFRARLEREKDRVIEAERFASAQVLLEAIDAVERALAAVRDAKGPLADGVRLTRDLLERHVLALGAERLSLVGSPFDPHLAEAIDTSPVSDPSRDQIVIEEVGPGYRLGSRILRPARVRVGKAVSA